MTNPIEIDWDNLSNYLNERDGKNLTVEQWKEYFSNKISAKFHKIAGRRKRGL